MNYTITIFKTLLFLTFLFNINALFAQDVEVFCPSDVCGGDTQYGAVDGIYQATGAMSGGQPIYEGPVGNVSYELELFVQSFGPALTFYNWKIKTIAGVEVYFESQPTQVSRPFSEAGSFTPTDPSHAPAPTAAVLPVELSYFNATKSKTTVQLNWATVTELNNEGFEVERSNDNRTWESLDFIEGQGTSYEIQNYEFVDKNPASGKNYYRLKQVDYDGRFVYSSILMEEMSIGSLEIYPNPVNGHTVNLQFPSSNYEDAELEIYDNLGRKVIQSVLVYGESQINISDLLPGFYIVSVKVGGQIFQERLIKK